MSNKWLRSTHTEAYILLGLEFAVILMIAVLVLFMRGMVAAYSLLLGGIVSIIPNVYFTHRLFRKTHPSQAKQIVRTFYRSEFIKLLLMAVLFITLIKWVAMSIVPFVVGFFFAQMGVWLTPLLFLKGEDKRQ